MAIALELAIRALRSSAGSMSSLIAMSCGSATPTEAAVTLGAAVRAAAGALVATGPATVSAPDALRAFMAADLALALAMRARRRSTGSMPAVISTTG